MATANITGARRGISRTSSAAVSPHRSRRPARSGPLTARDPAAEVRRSTGHRPKSTPAATNTMSAGVGGAGIGGAGGTLRLIRAGLEAAKSAAYVSSIALGAQAADADVEVALVLRWSVADEIGRQVEQIDGLLQGVAP